MRRADLSAPGRLDWGDQRQHASVAGVCDVVRRAATAPTNYPTHMASHSRSGSALANHVLVCQLMYAGGQDLVAARQRLKEDEAEVEEVVLKSPAKAERH